MLFHDLCLNHCLALRADAGTYYINGNWRIQLPGDVKADGTVFRYLRKGTLEKIIARGPINEPLHIMVSFAFTLSPYGISFCLPCPYPQHVVFWERCTISCPFLFCSVAYGTLCAWQWAISEFPRASVSKRG